MRIKSALATLDHKLSKILPESVANDLNCGFAVVAGVTACAMGMNQLGLSCSPRVQGIITELFDLYRVFGNEDIANFIRSHSNLSGASHVIAGLTSACIGATNFSGSNQDNLPPPGS